MNELEYKLQVAQQITRQWRRAHDEVAARLASVESENARLAPVIAWIRENHVKKHDSDTLDVDHGPIVEWDYCDWCADHGLPEDWPCMFVLALATTPAATAGGSAEDVG